MLAATGGRRSGDTLRRAVLTLDSDLRRDPVLLTAAACRASELGDLALGVRIARAAVAAGGGFEARLLLGNALTWTGSVAEADTELAALGSLAGTDAERVQAAIPRVAALAWGLARPAEAVAVLDTVASTISDDAATMLLAGMRSVVDAFLGHSVEAACIAAEVLADPRCSPVAGQLATWGLAAACGGLGRVEGLDERIRRIDARAEPFDTGLHEAAVVGSSWVRGLVLAGLLDEADQAAQRYRDTPGPGEVITSSMCAHVATSRGLVKPAARWFRQVLASDDGGWAFTVLADLPRVLAMAGESTSARQALVEMTTALNPAYAFLEPEVLLAGAWVAAADGSVSEAVTLAHQSAEVAASQHQPAVEVVAPHAAVCSPTGKGKSSPWPPPGCPTGRAPNG